MKINELVKQLRTRGEVPLWNQKCLIRIITVEKAYKNASEKPLSISIFLGYEKISQNKVYSCTPAVTISHQTGQYARMHVHIHTLISNK